MGTFLAVIGVGVFLWAAMMFAGGIFGQAGLLTFAVAVAAGFITCGLEAYWSLRDQLDRIEKKLDRQVPPQDKEDVSC